MKILFLDDERNIEDVTWVKYPEASEVITVRTFKEFCKAVDELDSLEDVLFSFDHDLQDFDQALTDIEEKGREYTGYSCAYVLYGYLLEGYFSYTDLNFVVHSQNPVGKANITYLLDNVVAYLEQEENGLTCDGCGHTGKDVKSDGYGFAICDINNCTSYSVRGLSPSDFF